MEQGNFTSLRYFILKGISDIPKMEIPVFLMVSLVYLITIGGNMMILVLILLDPQLQTPMYFFLGNLSVLDMSSTTVILHKVIVSFIVGDKTVSFLACMIQDYAFISFSADELAMLTAMSYDRYIAICNPLRYSTLINRRVYTVLAIVCWVWGFVETIPMIYIISSFSCYKDNTINHFFCDPVALMKLTCDDTSSLEFVLLFDGFLFTLCTNFLPTLISYVFIISTILRIRTSIGRRKAFQTCSSHLTVVILLYLTLFCQYEKPNLKDPRDSNKLMSLFNTVAVPMLNPLIYSLKNKDVMSAVKRRMLCRN